MAEWINVNDRLPKNNLARVLVFLKDDEFTKPIGFNKIDTDRCIDGKWVRWGEHVTHWMMLPPPPRTPKERGADKPKITCLNCKHLMFSDMYGECNKQLRIVNPSDTCEYAEPKERGGEK
jgi:hypothetical protein